MDSTIKEAVKIEYDALKAEQRDRIKTRDNLLYATLTAMAAIVVGTATNRPYLLLLIPPVAYILGWNYISNDEKITGIRRYVEESLIPRIPDDPEAFAWEVAHRSNAQYRSRRYYGVVADTVLYAIAPAGAIVVYWTQESTVPLVIVSVIELLGIGALACRIVGSYNLIGKGRKAV
jgi:hypothetical protein